jgi:3-oxoacyl-[acyl-carrier protein] reductase
VVIYKHDVYLPAGNWKDFWTGNIMRGHEKREIHWPENRGGGLFIREGAIIPLGPLMQYRGEKTMDEMDENFFDFVLNLNLKSVFIVTKEALPFMTEGGSIINFSSKAARDGGGPGAIAYSTAKGGVLTITRGLAKELGPKKIRVNCVSPGMINTTFHNVFTKQEVREKVAASTPLRREGEACEVGDLVLYLASERASFITGASIEINGGTYFI